MNRVIYKYNLPEIGKEAITMPLNAEILSAAFQNDELKIWAFIDELEELKTIRVFEVFQTGQIVFSDISTERKFIGTCLSSNHSYVVHVFERIN